MFAAITPDRGDRPELLEFCKHQVRRMNTKPDKHYIVDYEPRGDQYDLTARIRDGIRRAQEDGFDQVFIVENDDWYPKDYFDWIPDADFVGDFNSTYYTLVYRQYQTWNHPLHSSLFTTGFKISALDKFDWPEDHERFLDLSLWKYAHRRKKSIISRETKAIGIKHGIGLCGGKGHVQRMKYNDPELEWLKANVDSDAYEFYKSLKV